MTRSNGPTAQHGGWPQHANPADHDPHTAPPQNAPRRAPQPAFQQPQQPAEPSFGAPAGGYAYPPAAGNAAYAPQFDSYTPPTQPTRPPQHQPQYAEPQAAPPPMPAYTPTAYPSSVPAPQAYAPQPYAPQAYAQPAPAADYGHYGHGYDARADLRGSSYDQWPQPAAAPVADMRGYEASPAQPMHAQPQYADAYAPPPNPQVLDLNSYGLQPAHGHGDLDHAHQGTALEAPADHDDYAEYDDEPPAKSRKMLLVGALVGAIAVGGGLAYGYKALFPAKTQIATPVVKSDGQPARSKPADPGGKQFANPDSKILGKLGDNGAAPAAATTASSVAAGEADAAGTRKVQTLTVRPDGSFAAAPAPVEPPAPAAGQAVTVPGMTIVDGLGGSRQPPPVVAPTAPPVRTAAAAPTLPPAPAPTIPAAPPPVAKKIAAPPAPAPAETAAVAPKVAVPKKIAAATTTAAAAPKPTGAGYMAVLASVPASPKSRMDALKQFADMQQKYGTVLANKTPDVQEANLGDKGTYHRLLVGPPGSREQASSVCNDLKAAGYNGCWVMAY